MDWNGGIYFYHQSYNWVLFLPWLHLFILSGVISPLFSSSILGTYWPGEFIFQCPIFLPFYTVHGVLKARIQKWFAIPFSSGRHFVRTLHHDHPSWVALHGMAHSFIELDKDVVHAIRIKSSSKKKYSHSNTLTGVWQSIQVLWPSQVDTWN